MPSATEDNSPVTAKPGTEEHLIVGIGASAGGLEAFRSFFSAMPVDSGMALFWFSTWIPITTAHLPTSSASALQ